MVPVKVGDVLEFDALSASKDGGGGSSSPTKTEGRSLTTGRVVEVNPEDEGGGVTCTVQVSPYEPLQPLDLKRTFYKVVYEADALRSLSSEMVGWEIELESADTKHLERGVIKQVDCDINCALVLFAEGRKEWLDLTFFRVKISGHQPSPRDSNADGVAKESTKPHNTGDDTSGISDSITPSSPHNFHVAVSSLSMPRIDPDAFDWHLEGTHVELCNRDGHFLEGASLCSKPKSHLQLYNENRGFFEVDCSVQGFKVVIHGLENLKKIPMGQIVDVYSPLIGRFRSGTVLKAAVLGHLTPIRFGPSTAVEWLDLKSQTFKLVFLPHITDAFEHLDDMDHALQHADLSPHKSHEQDSHRSPDLEYPHLYEGQGIEIFDDHSKQYLKFKVAAQSNWSSEAYIFALSETCREFSVPSSQSPAIAAGSLGEVPSNSWKRALVVGLMNKHSLAAGVTQALLSAGASVVVSSKSPLSESHARSCGFQVPDASALHFAPCDVESDASVEQLLQRCGDVFDGRLDVLVHSVAFAPREAFATGLLDTPRAAWTQAMDVSAFSLVALARAARPLMVNANGGESRDRSVLALTYAGSTKVVPKYNVMGPAKAALEATARQLAYELGPDGIRVNCLSPGPMNTVSARGIPGISKMRTYAEEHAPLRRNSSMGDVGSVAAFLSSDLAAAVTGQTIYVDGGLSAMAPYAKDE
ncbi:hypothetical protein PF008_g23537 [Phytophthora fragariae]|uniref:Uncharacterized protein n=1 Tax=Phytophthora fragariae TaxID=53985 RepID=A0A6G0QRI5_9STRA|nr:hypothetical protein PF008_g23537 [Phytophthora fragariae]